MKHHKKKKDKIRKGKISNDNPLVDQEAQQKSKPSDDNLPLEEQDKEKPIVGERFELGTEPIASDAEPRGSDIEVDTKSVLSDTRQEELQEMGNDDLDAVAKKPAAKPMATKAKTVALKETHKIVFDNKAVKVFKPGKHNEFVAANEIRGSFSANCQPVTLEMLIAKEQDREEMGEDNTGFPVETDEDKLDEVELDHLAANKFLHVMLLGLTRAKVDHKVEITGFSRKFKRARLQTAYKYKYTFASLQDRIPYTAVLLETNNDIHNTWWFWNKSKTGVKVGSLFAIQNPRAIGYMPTRSVIIETKKPLIQLQAPPIRPAPILADSTSHDMRYFILKEHKIGYVEEHLPVPWKTVCNAEYCDRLEFTEKQNITCGCWGQNSRNDTSARNTVLQFDFKFRDNGKTWTVKNFTSLRTSRLFFENEKIVGDYDSLLIEENTQKLKKAFLKVIGHVNSKNGWTIVGWYIRGERETEDVKEDNEAKMLSDSVKINVSYLYPTTVSHSDIPSGLLFKESDLALPAVEMTSTTATPHLI